jgi:hypothetical protein
LTVHRHEHIALLDQPGLERRALHVHGLHLGGYGFWVDM